MKTLLKRSALLFALSISVLVNFPLRASADSTANLILSTKCRGGYNVNIWQNRTSGELLYRATSPNGDLSLGRGTKQLTEGVKVYKFRNKNYEYWVWDGTLDNQQSGTLEVYKNNRILLHQACTKS
uniref:C-type lysozyme inhibitor domain-containing protein n=1 Tax=Tolypothrix bouteillei VB521301 TaxID=1479485 RepID=A0A0C1N216_9CYAN